jgi:hypothetical protein
MTTNESPKGNAGALQALDPAELAAVDGGCPIAIAFAFGGGVVFGIVIGIAIGIHYAQHQ